MKLAEKTVVLTGAAGGMGALMAAALADRGCSLVLSDINSDGLTALTKRLPGRHIMVAADLRSDSGINELVAACSDQPSIDVLINAAGISDFALYEQMPAERVALALDINLRVPMLLVHALLPLLRKSPDAAIVNVGSTFGAIGYPGFTAYCASKAGLRGFTEALRRELADTPVDVCYLAPRATRTDMNNAAVVELNDQLGNAMDPPQFVIDNLLQLLEKDKKGDLFLGWPEKLFVRINSVLPAIVDNALGKQLSVIKGFAEKSVRGT